MLGLGLLLEPSVSLVSRHICQFQHVATLISAGKSFSFLFICGDRADPRLICPRWKTLLSLRRAYLFYHLRPRDEFLSRFPSFTTKKNNIFSSKSGRKWRRSWGGHFFQLHFVSLGEFVLLDFGSFWKIRSKRLLHGRPSATQAEQLPGRQSVHFFFSLNECLYRWNFKSPAIYIMECFFFIYIPHRRWAFWAKTAPNRLLIFHVAQIKFFLYPLAGSCWSPPPASKAYASFFGWKLPSSL